MSQNPTNNSTKKTLELLHSYFSLYPHGLVRGGQEETLCVSSFIHGDEPIGLYVMDEILKKEKDLASSLCFILGHELAGNEGRRYLEKDLNRLFGILDKNEASPDERVAMRIEQNLKEIRAKNLIDIHQSRENTLGPFMIALDTERNYAFSRTLDPQLPLILIKESLGHNALPEYALKEGFRSALTLELGNRFDQSESLVRRGLDMIKRGVEFSKDEEAAIYYWKQKREKNKSDHKLYLWREDFIFDKSEWSLKQGIKNLTPVAIGDNIGKNTKTNAPLLSPCKGIIIFPQYDKTAKQDGNVCVFCDEIYKNNE